MKQAGRVQKMATEAGSPIQYWLRLDEHRVPMNELIGSELTLSFAGRINCTLCDRKTKKSYNQGFCYPCMINAPEASECIIKPELCQGHEGGGRDPEWEKQYHVQPHYVYLALSSAVKVGVTREPQVPTRWIDQGASQAIKLAMLPNRYLAGTLEVALKQHFTDRTNWRKMLKNEVLDDVDLAKVKNDLLDKLSDEHRGYVVEDDTVMTLDYPVEAYPTKVTSVGFDKLPEISGTLMGIKGQYLLLNDNRVLNVRKHTAYHIEISAH